MKPVNNKIIYLNLSLLIILGVVGTYLNSGFRLDDALIYYRYVQNFIDGNGLVYNAGENFNALTSPFYTFISLPVSSITGEVEISQTFLNGFFLIASSFILFLILSSNGYIIESFIASLLMVSFKYFYLVFGMETNLFVLLSLLLIFFYFRKNFLMFSVIGGLLFITRGEGLFLILILTFFALREAREYFRWSYVAIFIIIISSQYIFNYLYYGYPIQHTLSAKILQGSSGLWNSYGFLFQFGYLFSSVFNNQPIFVIYLVLFALTGFVNHIRERFPFILFLNLTLLTLFYTFLNIPEYHWYYSIHFLSFIVFISYGCVDAFKYIRSLIIKKYIRIILLLLIFAYPAGTQIQVFSLLRKHTPQTEYIKVSEWIKHNTPGDSKIAAVEIGHIGWYSERYIIDILGLTNPLNAEFIGSRQFDKWYEFYKPDYIVAHDPVWGHEQSISSLVEKGFYIEEKNFQNPKLKLYKKNVSIFE